MKSDRANRGASIVRCYWQEISKGTSVTARLYLQRCFCFVLSHLVANIPVISGGYRKICLTAGACSYIQIPTLRSAPGASDWLPGIFMPRADHGTSFFQPARSR
jgi:hypothetical protein